MAQHTPPRITGLPVGTYDAFCAAFAAYRAHRTPAALDAVHKAAVACAPAGLGSTATRRLRAMVAHPAANAPWVLTQALQA